MQYNNPCQSRNWCFTDFELLDWDKIYNEYKDIIQYICWGTETCPTTQKTHLQGWIQFSNKKRMNGIKKVCQSKKIHLESCRGTQEQNDKYCKKENKYKTIGSFIKQGQRTDLENIKKKITEGCTMRDIAETEVSKVRCVWFYFKEQDDLPTEPSSSLLLEQGLAFSPFKFASRGKFKVLYSRKFLITNDKDNPQFTRIYNYKISLTDKMPNITYDLAIPQKYHIYFFIISDTTS